MHGLPSNHAGPLYDAVDGCYCWHLGAKVLRRLMDCERRFLAKTRSATMWPLSFTLAHNAALHPAVPGNQRTSMNGCLANVNERTSSTCDGLIRLLWLVRQATWSRVTESRTRDSAIMRGSMFYCKLLGSGACWSV
jgi:hypothetical protein